jgi:hypothetical protein
MIKIENVEVAGWEHAIRGMRNPMNSWDKSDSHSCGTCGDCDHCADDYNCPYGYDYKKTLIGPNDYQLMMNLAHGGPVHAKYRRMITVYLDITAPLYWWKEFDTYKVGTVANSCSTMHKIHAKEFTLEDFSHEHLMSFGCESAYSGETPFVETSPVGDESTIFSPHGVVTHIMIPILNDCRNKFLKTHDKKYWWQMIQLLPSSYNQKRTVMLNYEVLAAMYESRKNHKLDEWRTFCKWIEMLPYSELIIGEDATDEKN